MGKGEATRKAILDEAMQVASRVGLSGLTIGSLAAQTGLSKSGLFAHFRSKESLQLQVLEHATAHFTDTVLRPALAAPRGEPRLRELFERWLRWDLKSGGCLFVAASMELDDQPGPVRDQLVSSQLDWFDTIAQIVRAGVRDGHFHQEVDPEQFAHDLHGVMLALHYTSRLLGDPRAEERARRALDALIATARQPTGEREPQLTR